MRVMPLQSKQDSKHFSIEREDPSMSNDMEGGYVISRARFTRPPRRKFTTGFTDLSQAEYDQLDQFFAGVKGGSEMFEWTIPTTGEVCTVRFKGTLKGEYAGMGGNHRYNVSEINLEEV